MRLTQFLAAAAAFSLAATPAVAVPANPAAKLSLGQQDSGATAKAEPKPRNSTYVLAGVGLIAIVLAALAMGKSDSTPASA